MCLLGGSFHVHSRCTRGFARAVLRAPWSSPCLPTVWRSLSSLSCWPTSLHRRGRRFGLPACCSPCYFLLTTWFCWGPPWGWSSSSWLLLPCFVRAMGSLSASKRPSGCWGAGFLGLCRWRSCPMRGRCWSRCRSFGTWGWCLLRGHRWGR